MKVKFAVLNLIIVGLIFFGSVLKVNAQVTSQTTIDSNDPTAQAQQFAANANAVLAANGSTDTYNVVGNTATCTNGQQVTFVQNQTTPTTPGTPVTTTGGGCAADGTCGFGGGGPVCQGDGTSCNSPASCCSGQCNNNICGNPPPPPPPPHQSAETLVQQTKISVLR